MGRGERICGRRQTRLWEERNALAHGGKRVRGERGTHLHAETNVVARECKRTFVIRCIWTVLYMHVYMHVNVRTWTAKETRNTCLKISYYM